MPAYVDTGALVKRFVAEVGSAWVRRLLAHPAQYVIYTSALSPVEVISALQRRVRAGSLEVTQAQRLAHRVTFHFGQRYQVVVLTQAVVNQACVGLQIIEPLQRFMWAQDESCHIASNMLKPLIAAKQVTVGRQLLTKGGWYPRNREQTLGSLDAAFSYFLHSL